MFYIKVILIYFFFNFLRLAEDVHGRLLSKSLKSKRLLVSSSKFRLLACLPDNFRIPLRKGKTFFVHVSYMTINF